MARRILYFINPVSGPKKKLSPVKVISEATNAEQIDFEFAFTNENGEYPYLADKIRREKITDVVICGGDGTVNQVVASLLEADVNIGIIPRGSGNGLALAAKIPKNINKALKLIFTGKPSYVDAFFINEKFSCMLCGLGFDAQVAHDFANQPNRGLSTYIQQTILNFVKALPYSFDITIKGKTFSTEAFFISIANGNQFGNNFKIAPKASLDDGLIDIIVVNKMSKTRLLWSVVRHILAGKVNHHEERHFHKKEVMYFQADKLLINNNSMAPLHIDGDPVDTFGHFEVQVLPAAFRLIRP